MIYSIVPQVSDNTSSLFPSQIPYVVTIMVSCDRVSDEIYNRDETSRPRQTEYIGKSTKARVICNVEADTTSFRSHSMTQIFTLDINRIFVLYYAISRYSKTSLC